MWDETFERLSIYGNNPPVLCWERLAAEKAELYKTDEIQRFAILGQIAKESEKRGLTSTAYAADIPSFAAWLLGATKVNPLPPHYRCPKCANTEFVSGIADGFDLPPKKCLCGEEFIRDGHNILFQGCGQSKAHRGTSEICISEHIKSIAVEVIREFYKGEAEILSLKLVYKDGHVSSIERYVVLNRRRPKPLLLQDGFCHIESEKFWNWRNEETVFTISYSDQLERIHLFEKRTNMHCPNFLMLPIPQIAERLYQKKREKSTCITDITNKFRHKEAHDFHLLLQITGLCRGSAIWSERRFDDKTRICNNCEELLEKDRATFREIPIFGEDIWNDISHALACNGIQDNERAIRIMKRAQVGLYYRNGMSRECEKMLLSLGLPEWYPDYLRKVTYMPAKADRISKLMLDIILEWCCMNCPQEYQIVFGKTNQNLKANI